MTMKPLWQVPYVAGSETSKAAAESIESTVGSIEAAVYDAVVAAGDCGITCDEIEVKLGLSHQTASARVAYLSRDKRIGIAGKRKSRSGRDVNVYVVNGEPLPERGDVKSVRMAIREALEYANAHNPSHKFAHALSLVDRIAIRKA